jgi:hypothetical protein
MTDTASIAWLGLDAHSRNCLLAQLDDHGTELNCWRFPTSQELFLKHVQAIPVTDKRLLLEESNLARWISQLLKPHVQQLVVCDARRNRLISQDAHKHDLLGDLNMLGYSFQRSCQLLKLTSFQLQCRLQPPVSRAAVITHNNDKLYVPSMVRTHCKMQLVLKRSPLLLSFPTSPLTRYLVEQ